VTAAPAGIRILIVEDDPTTSLLVTSVVRRQGSEVTGTAATGAQAIELAGAHGYLLKPLDARALRPTVEMALAKQKLERERLELIEHLEGALAEVAQLRGLLPVCAWCKKVRDDAGYWDSIEGYLARHLSTQYTHGICQDCATKLEAEF
jgi:DNA-binding NtrC family response regulator